MAKKLFDEVLKENVFFQDQYEKAFVKSNDLTFSLKSKRFDKWLNQQYRKLFNAIPNPSVLGNVKASLESEVLLASPKVEMKVRITSNDGDYIYDLADNKGQVININNNDWYINPSGISVAFHRSDNMLAQLEPVRGGNIEKVLDFINITNKEQRLLLLTTLVAYFIPDISYPVSVLFGHQGSAKTTASRMLKMLVDPSKSRPSVMPKKADDMVLQLSQNHLVAYDNIDSINESQSDMLCRAVTGSSFEKRELYSDESLVTIAFQGAIVLNGINLVATRSDLLDRCIIFELERIDNIKRITEKELWENFDSAVPSILGGIFDAVCKARRIYPTIQGKKFRMADYTQWGCAIAEALGHSTEEFMLAYENNRKVAEENAVNNNPVIECVIAFMYDKAELYDTVGNVFNALYGVAFQLGVTRDRGFPKSSTKLLGALKKAEVDLKAHGIQIIPGNRSSKGKMLTIRKVVYQEHKAEPQDEVKKDSQDHMGNIVTESSVELLEGDAELI